MSKKNKLKLNNIIFTEEGNLFTNNKNNLIINSGKLNINSNHIENTTSIKYKNMPFFTQKRKNTLTIKSDNKEVSKNKKINKNFRQYFKDGKNARNTGGNHTNYNFYNIFMDKKIIIDNNINLKSSRLNNNKAASKCKYNKTYEKNNKEIMIFVQVKKVIRLIVVLTILIK